MRPSPPVAPASNALRSGIGLTVVHWSAHVGAEVTKAVTIRNAKASCRILSSPYLCYPSLLSQQRGSPGYQDHAQDYCIHMRQVGFDQAVFLIFPTCQSPYTPRCAWAIWSVSSAISPAATCRPFESIQNLLATRRANGSFCS